MCNYLGNNPLFSRAFSTSFHFCLISLVHRPNCPCLLFEFLLDLTPSVFCLNSCLNFIFVWISRARLVFCFGLHGFWWNAIWFNVWLLALDRLLKRLKYPGATEFGVDLSQANISIQLDVGKGGNSGSNAIAPVVEVGYEVPFFCLSLFSETWSWLTVCQIALILC